MKAAYWQRGEALDYKNTTEEKIEADTVVVLGKHIGVAGGDIYPGETGSLHMVGVFEIQKKAGVAINAGDDIAYTEEGIDKAAGTVMGYAIEAAVADAATIKVKLLG